MSEETTQPTEPTTPDQPAPEPAAPKPAPSAETQNTDSGSGDHMIPKSRFDEVNTALKEMKAQLSDFQKKEALSKKAVEEAERKAAEEQGKWKELYESERSKHEEAQTKAQQAEERVRQAELATIRLKVATELQIPAALADRLRGENEEEIKADAAKILESLPKGRPQAPTATDATNGINSTTPTPQKTEAEMKEEAARLGVDFNALKQVYEQRALQRN